MKKNILMIGVLVGLNLIQAEAKASGMVSNFDASTTTLSTRKETLSDVIQLLIKKDFTGAHVSSSASLTISILENFQNNQSAYLKASKAEQALFNETVKSISNQANNFQDEKTLVWLKEINKSAKAINAIWAVIATEPVIEADIMNTTEENNAFVVVFQK